jgi:hypothetical protein
MLYFGVRQHAMLLYENQVISVCSAELPTDQDFRALHGSDSEGISVWVSAKLAPMHVAHGRLVATAYTECDTPDYHAGMSAGTAAYIVTN